MLKFAGNHRSTGKPQMGAAAGAAIVTPVLSRTQALGSRVSTEPVATGAATVKVWAPAGLCGSLLQAGLVCCLDGSLQLRQVCVGPGNSYGLMQATLGSLHLQLLLCPVDEGGQHVRAHREPNLAPAGCSTGGLSPRHLCL